MRAYGKDRLTVVKLGGSYALYPHLAVAVGAIVAAAKPVVVVPGGGPFVDAVREAQGPMGYDDAAAHRMALLGMCQFAEAVAALHNRLCTTNSIAAMRDVLAHGQIPVWSPWSMADGLETLPESWDITSDSLAAWLAGKLRAARLVLLKSVPAPAEEISAAAAAEEGVVDVQFPAFLRLAGLSAWWLEPAQLGGLTALIDGEREIGARITSNTTASPPPNRSEARA